MIINNDVFGHLINPFCLPFLVFSLCLLFLRFLHLISLTLDRFSFFSFVLRSLCILYCHISHICMQFLIFECNNFGSNFSSLQCPNIFFYWHWNSIGFRRFRICTKSSHTTAFHILLLFAYVFWLLMVFFIVYALSSTKAWNVNVLYYSRIVLNMMLNVFNL